MQIQEIADGFVLQKAGQPIGVCRYVVDANDGAITLTQFEIDAQWRRKGYGSYLCKEFLKRTGGYDATLARCYRVVVPRGQTAPIAFFEKFGFAVASVAQGGLFAQGVSDTVPKGGTAACMAGGTASACADATCNAGTVMLRQNKRDLTAIAFAQQFLTQNLRSPAFCIDATCGNGHDSLFLAQLMGEGGHLLALDIQPQAVQNTTARLAAAGILPAQYTVLCQDHADLHKAVAEAGVLKQCGADAAPVQPCDANADNIEAAAAKLREAKAGCADAVLFNFGWLPGADHSVFSNTSSSLPALESALDLLKPGGILSAILYSGEGIGHVEKTAILAWLKTLPIAEYTVLICDFANWAKTAPLPCFVIKK